jgi:sterol desaturase/sphingolipid hydroxylase (fatty acid hydroxylase superfamily)
VFGRTLDFPVPRKHRAHHRDPRDLSLVFIPVHSYLYTLPLVAGLWWVVTPTPALAATGITAHVALALHYEWVHFLVHTRWRPRWRPYRALWHHHRLHHFRNEHYWFGVTRRVGDRLLGTLPAPDAVPTSPTCLSLGVDPAATAGSEA